MPRLDGTGSSRKKTTDLSKQCYATRAILSFKFNAAKRILRSLRYRKGADVFCSLSAWKTSVELLELRQNRRSRGMLLQCPSVGANSGHSVPKCAAFYSTLEDRRSSNKVLWKRSSSVEMNVKNVHLLCQALIAAAAKLVKPGEVTPLAVIGPLGEQLYRARSCPASMESQLNLTPVNRSTKFTLHTQE